MEMDVFKSSSAQAKSAAEAIRDALRAVGVPNRDLREVRPQVLAHGRPVVNLGAWRLDAIEKVAAALQLGAAMMEAQSRPDA